MKLTGRLLPPKAWGGSDGCSAVPDHHYRQCCKAHDWQYRHAGFKNGNDGEARKFADTMLRECMKEANRRDAPAVQPQNAFYWLRWWWRPLVWYVALRVVGGHAWVPLAERDRNQPKVQT